MKESWAFKKSVGNTAWPAHQKSKPFQQGNNYEFRNPDLKFCAFSAVENNIWLAWRQTITYNTLLCSSSPENLFPSKGLGTKPWNSTSLFKYNDHMGFFTVWNSFCLITRVFSQYGRVSAYTAKSFFSVVVCSLKHFAAQNEGLKGISKICFFGFFWVSSLLVFPTLEMPGIFSMISMCLLWRLVTASGKPGSSFTDKREFWVLL